MHCPHCHNDNGSWIVDSRDLPDMEMRRRRHECKQCRQRFTTYEIPAIEYEKINALSIDTKQFDYMIATLRAIKVQFAGNKNGKN